MAKKESTFANMTITLLVVTLIASTALGYVYELTKTPIEKAKILKKSNAVREILPDFDNSPIEESREIQKDGGTIRMFPAKNNGQLVGTAVETFTNNGFSGTIKLMVGFLPDGTINDISVLEHKETPGLGDKIQKSKSNFSEQFVNKNPDEFDLKVRKDGGDVDAITAATISSRAYCDAVEKAYSVYMNEKNN